MLLKDTIRPGKTVVVLLTTQIALMGAEAIALIQRITMLRNQVDDARLNGTNAGVNVIAFLLTAVFLATVITWCVWQHHAQYNATLLAAGPLKYTPAWAVIWWFIPIANLFMPFLTVRELWRASHGGAAWRAIKTWPVIGWWWAAWLAGNVHVWWGSSGGSIAFGTSPMGHPITASDYISHDSWQVLSLALTSIAAVLAIMIVRSVAALQQSSSEGWSYRMPESMRSIPPPPPPA